uniref:Uncharacterized protein n=1 Tax=Tanacetum cinerariifolium TaxID=118510 RepID=A0A699HBZ5_TANCI|nr:hypothetical protein [Tanacetum cinerariifolium]
MNFDCSMLIFPYNVFNMMIKHGLQGDLEDRGVASIATSSSSSGTISTYLFSFAVSSATLSYSCSSSFCFLALSCFSSCPALLKLPSDTFA